MKVLCVKCMTLSSSTHLYQYKFIVTLLYLCLDTGELSDDESSGDESSKCQLLLKI